MSHSHTKKAICVGGPNSGRLYKSVTDVSFVAPVKRNDAGGDRIEYVTYRRQEVHCPEGIVSFWVPEDQTMIESIEKLLDRFQNEI